MIFEVKPYYEDVVDNPLLTARSLKEMPTLSELEDMYFNGFRFYWNREQVTLEQLRIKMKVQAEDEAWERECESIPVDNLEKEVEEEILEPVEEVEEDQILEPVKETVKEPEVKYDEVVEHNEEDTVKEPEQKEEKKPEVKTEKLQKGIIALKDNEECGTYPTIAQASRELNIPAYKISDSIKLGKEVNGYHFQKLNK